MDNKKMTQERFFEILENFRKHPLEFKDEVKDAKSGKEAYHRLLDIKYGKVKMKKKQSLPT
jgi:hypothetical protein